ncbi:MAG TPA: hypothetical protein H9875_08630 [Candidatus Levilactobacillus faecigallinarum]|uniref:LITAF domain-containing protein n=1 Tax=Candidatus Levilactobacillus faecigallinarum TaxID=2838638 RepID=A0A9D1U580_9LACO|nr:hypothetical protein [Candidatus Levilactobacillus faecigallinarum]
MENDHKDSVQSSKEKHEPKFWKGNGPSGFIDGLFAALIIGTINMLWLNIWHLGLIIGIIVWLIVGTNPRFKDKRTPEQRQKDYEEAKKKLDAKNTQNAVAKEQKHAEKQQIKVAEAGATKITVTKEEKPSRKAPHCPKCKSNNIQILDNKRKFSLTKTVVGGVIGAGAGAAVGALAGKRGKKYHAVCMNCGKKFIIKL